VEVEASPESIAAHAAARSSLKNIFLCHQRNLPKSQGPCRGFARMIADHKNANFKRSKISRWILIRVNQR
jgi:hypothetical protein